MVARHLDVVTVQLQPDVDRVRILYDRYEGSPESVVSSNEEPRELRNRTRGNLVRHLLEQADRDELMPRTPGVAIDGRWLPPARVAPGFGKRAPVLRERFKPRAAEPCLEPPVPLALVVPVPREFGRLD